MNVIRKPNIVVFMADQMKAPGPDGYPCSTPNLDRMAAEGISFTDVACPSPVCSPSRATFHTGLAPSFHGLYANVHLSYSCKNMDASIPTLASTLREQGYRTGLSGVWHVSAERPVTDYGFDEASAEEKMFDAGDMSPLRTISLPGDSESGKNLLASVYADGDDAFSIDKEVAHAVSFLETSAKTPENPFFLFVSTRIPHVPWKVSQKYLDKVPLDDIVLPDSFVEDLAGERCPDRFEYNGCDYAYWRGSATELREALQCYYALMTKVDEQVGVIADTLKRLGLDDDTLFLFTSDHGEMGGAHNLVGKGFDFYNEVTNVPMMLRWPNGITPGSNVDSAVGFEDIMPTVCELTDMDVPDKCKGQSLVPFFNSESDPAWRDSILLEQYSHVYPGFAVALRSAEWLYVLDPTRGEQLYDRIQDPCESVNLALDPTNYGVLCGWRDKIVANMKKTKHPMATRIATTVEFLNNR